jgi:hypothetical protein
VLFLLGLIVVVAVVAYGLGYLHGWTNGNGRLYREIENTFRSEDSFMKRKKW